MNNVFTALACATIFSLPVAASAQGVRIGSAGTPNASAALDISSSKGLLLPRLTETQMLALSPVPGLLVYNSDRAGFFGYQSARAASLISQIAASSSTNSIFLYQQQYSNPVTQTFTAVATGTDWATVYGYLYSIGNVVASPGSSASLDVSFSISNANTGAVLASSRNGTFTLGTSSTSMRLALPCYGLTVGQSYQLTVTRQDNSNAGFALYFSYGDPYTGGALQGLSGADLEFQTGQDAHVGGWVSITP